MSPASTPTDEGLDDAHSDCQDACDDDGRSLGCLKVGRDGDSRLRNRVMVFLDRIRMNGKRGLMNSRRR